MSNEPARDARGRDILGFLAERCPHCEAHMFLGDAPDARPICLNACTLPAWQYRKLLHGLRVAAVTIDPEGKEGLEQ